MLLKHYQILCSMNKDIKRTTIHFYEGYKYEGEYVPVKLRNTIEIEYDSDGRVKSRTYYNYNEAKLSDMSDDIYVTRRRVENGVVIYEEFDSNNEIVGYNKYDREGHLLESLSLNGQKFFYSYDENGNEIEHHSLDEDGKLLYRTRYEYDSNGRMIRSFHENDEPCSCQHNYSRDVKGNIVMTTLNDVDDYVYSHLKGKDHEFAFETKDELFEDKYINEVRLSKSAKLLVKLFVKLLPALYEIVGKLCGDIHLVAHVVFLKYLTECRLASGVYIRRVEVIYTAFYSGHYLSLGLLHIGLPRLLAGKSHTSEAEYRKLFSVSVLAIIHFTAPRGR